MAKKNNTQTNNRQYRTAFDEKNTWAYDLQMGKIAKNIEKEMHAKGLDEPELARRSGVPQPTIWRILHGGSRDPRSSNLKKIAEALNVTESYLRGENPEDKRPERPGDDYVPVKMASFHLQAGVTGYALEYLDEDKAPIFFREDWFREKKYNPKKMVACQIKGDSMEPRLYAGDVVIINLDDTTPFDGDVFAVNYEGELVIKRLIRDRGEWYLQSDNPDKIKHPNKICAGEYCLILGKVVYKQSGEI
jgi:phage repressor protein C with HTH and peptisase S24 domain